MPRSDPKGKEKDKARRDQDQRPQGEVQHREVEEEIVQAVHPTFSGQSDTLRRTVRSRGDW